MAATVLAKAIYGNGSDGRHVCSKYHGHALLSRYYVGIVPEAICCCRFVVMGDMCVQSITAIRTSISNCCVTKGAL